MSAVTVIIHRVIIVVDKIPSPEIIHKAIAIIINPIASFIPTDRINAGFPRIAPNIPEQIWVIVVNTTVDNCYHNAVSSQSLRPNFWSFN